MAKVELEVGPQPPRQAPVIGRLTRFEHDLVAHGSLEGIHPEPDGQDARQKGRKHDQIPENLQRGLGDAKPFGPGCREHGETEAGQRRKPKNGAAAMVELVRPV
ncbi:hypothetical protein IID10_05510 [candidate division KSB1 bacterium]|nr:hypothetical protein [candidate division KSB1 bacterium]